MVGARRLKAPKLKPPPPPPAPPMPGGVTAIYRGSNGKDETEEASWNTQLAAKTCFVELRVWGTNVVDSTHGHCSQQSFEGSKGQRYNHTSEENAHVPLRLSASGLHSNRSFTCRGRNKSRRIGSEVRKRLWLQKHQKRERRRSTACHRRLKGSEKWRVFAI